MRRKIETEVESFKSRLNVTNVAIAPWSMKPIWGGSSLITCHLRLMQDLEDMKSNGTWNWDYFINLSESDFPVK